jgi:tRNA A-37 threonylcarbamoyl transferase component Bud32
LELNESIGIGAQATVYSSGNYAIKLFKENCNKSNVFYEALINSMVEDIGIPVPKVYEVLNVENKMAIKMDYIKGISLFEAISKDIDNAVFYIEQMVKLQIEIHSKKILLPLSLKNKLQDKIISNKELSDAQKNKVLILLSKLPDGNELCHGDFHGNNILVCHKKYWVIDWIDSTYGCADGDACRTYMIFYLYARELAEVYLSLYCSNTGKTRDEILTWLPVIAAARLSENNSNEKETLLFWINENYK